MSGPSFSYGASPSVSKERWIKHAVHKLSKGYNLIIDKNRKVANFYKGYGDFESCSYKTARKLILQEFVDLVGDHEMGLEYTLKYEKGAEIDTALKNKADDSGDVEMDTESAIEEIEGVIDEDDLDEAGVNDDDEEEPKYHDDDDEEVD